MEIRLSVVPSLRLNKSYQMNISARIKIGNLEYSGNAAEVNRKASER
jgi:hypothetical protein